MNYKIMAASNRFLLLVGIAAALACPSTYASSYQGTVVDTYAAGGNIYIILDSGAFGSPNTCANGARGIYGIDPTTPYGRAMLSIALTAKVTGRLVWAAGDGNCTPTVLGVPVENLVQIDLKG